MENEFYINQRHINDDPVTGKLDPGIPDGEIAENFRFRQKTNLSRADFLRLAGIGTLAVAVTTTTAGCALTKVIDAAQKQEGEPDKEKEKPEVKFGFNTHMRPNAGEGESHTFEAFKTDVDFMAENGMKMIRFNLQEWDVVDNSASSKGSIIWNEANIQKYQETISYAKSKNLEIFFVVTPPTYATTKYKDDTLAYVNATAEFYSGIATRFGKMIDICQIANEPDDHSFYTYADINRLPDEKEEQYRKRYKEYLSKFGLLVLHANKEMKAVNPNIRTTVNVSKWVGKDPGIQFEEVALFDAACQIEPGGQANGKCSTIDIITIDYYPDLNEKEIKSLPEQIQFFTNRYGLPIIIGELGMQTGNWNEQQQAQSINSTIDSLMGGTVLPEAILIYERRDQSVGDGTGNTYGLFNAKGEPKASAEAVLQTIKKYQKEEQK